MKHFEYKYKRYVVQAKRKNTNEKWTDWTAVDTYEEATRHALRVENLGYESKIVDKGGETE